MHNQLSKWKICILNLFNFSEDLTFGSNVKSNLKIAFEKYIPNATPHSTVSSYNGFYFRFIDNKEIKSYFIDNQPYLTEIIQRRDTVNFRQIYLNASA